MEYFVSHRKASTWIVGMIALLFAFTTLRGAPPAEKKKDADGGTAFLDDLPILPGKVTNCDFFGIHGKTGYPKGIVQQVRVRGIPQAHAISQAANSKGTVHVDFDLQGQFTKFRGKAGFLQATEEDGLPFARRLPDWNAQQAKSPVKFQILGDGKSLWTSRPIQAFDDWEDFEVDVPNVKVLRLQVTCDGPANFCWSAWANPVLVRAPSSKSNAKYPSIPSTPAKVKEKPASPTSEATVIEDVATLTFPEPVTQICWGGSGRYLIGHLPKAAQLIVYDVVVARELKRIDLGGQDARFAANQTDLIVAIPNRNLQRFDLETLQRQSLVPLSAKVEIARMGCASQGPLLLWSQGAVELYDPADLQRLKIGGNVLNGSTRYGFDVRASADGRTFVGWTTGISGQRYFAMQIDNGRASLIGSAEEYSHNERYAVPNADGSLILVSMKDLFTSIFRPVASNLVKDSVWVPSPDPRFLVAVTDTEHGVSCRVAIHTAADRTSIYAIEKFESVSASSSPARWGYLGSEARVLFSPQLERLVAIPSSNDRVIIRRLNIEEAVRQGASLVVLSRPPERIRVGEKFEYAIQAISPVPGPLKFALVSGPEGMTVSADGKVTWQADQRPIGGMADVVVSVHDTADREVLHQFQLDVRRPASLASGSPASDSNKPPKSDPTQVEDLLELVSDNGFPTINLQWIGAWLVQDRELWSIGPDGVTVKDRRLLPKTYTAICERKDYFVAFERQSKMVDVLSKADLKIQHAWVLSGVEITDLALHPSKPLAYVAMKVGTDVPGYRFVVLNEKTGKGTSGDDDVGTWLKLTPDGRSLITGYRDIYENGSELILNPDRWHVVPRYGNLDWLIRYDLDKNGLPTVKQVNTEAGGNGKGIRMSPDGKRVTYLSHVGSPLHSGNLRGLSTRDFTESPVEYATNGVGTSSELAYHPSLPLVASPGSGSAVFFHRENGKQENDRLKQIPDLLAKGKVNRILFSPDGMSLLFDIRINVVRYLVKADLNLTDAEKQHVEKAVPQLPTLVEDAPRKKIPLRDLHALGGGQGKPMSAADISRTYSNSVVIVASDEGSSGTGFAIGSGGYVLTCAHCVSELQQNWVIHRSTTSTTDPPTKSAAEVINLDEDHDIALLKVAARLNPVRLGIGNAVQSGERVNVIGNPGLGNLILDQTITEGIVSNPARMLEKQTFIQTSAAVNPGSSGGPLFNDHGLVIGMVALKGRIEGAGFAVNALDLGRFLVASAILRGEEAQLEREWYDASDTKRILAAYQGMENSKVKLLEGERKREVALDRLSKPDREFLKLLTGE